MSKRPFAWVCGAVTPTLLIAPFLPMWLTLVLMIAAFAAAVAVCCVRPLRKRSALWAVLFCVGAAFFFFRYHEQHTFAPLEQAIGQKVTLQAQVSDLPEAYDGSTRYSLNVMSGGLPKGSTVLFYDTHLKLSLKPGDIVEGTFTVEPGYDRTDLKSYVFAKSNGWVVRIEPYGPIATSTPREKSLSVRLLDIRLRIREGLSHDFTDDTAGLLGAMSFGDRQMLTDDVVSDYKTVGLSHVLAVSGLHLAVVTDMLYRAFRRLRLRKRIASAISIVFVLLFMAMTGFSASVTRAGIMTILVLVARLLFREPDGLNSVGFAVLLMTVFQPFAVWDIGLQLSATATIGLLTVLPHWKRSWDAYRDTRFGHLTDRWYMRLFRWVGDQLLTSAAATVMTLIPVIVYYGGVSLMTPLANLFIVPLANLLVPLGVIVGLLCSIPGAPDWLITLIGVPSGLLVKLQNGIVSLFADVPLTDLPIEGVFPIVWITGVLILLFLSRRYLWRTRVMVGACACTLLLGIFAGRQMTPPQQVYALSVGEDVAVCLTYRGKTGVVASLHEEDAVYALKNALARIGVDELAFLWLTDPEGEGVRAIDILLHDVPTEQVMTAPSGTYLPELIARVGEDKLVCHTDDPVTVWNAGILVRAGGWTRIEWGDVTLLAASPKAVTDDLPPPLRAADIVVYAASPPADWRSIAADELVVGTRWYTDQLPVRTTAYETDCLL